MTPRPVTEPICVERGKAKLCFRLLLSCCNDMAYEVTLEVDDKSYYGIGVYIDNLSKDCIVWKEPPEEVTEEEIDDMLLEATAILDARMYA